MDIVSYIAGFTVRSTLRLLKCEMCKNSLVEHEDFNKPRHKLVRAKSRGYLTYASESVYNICVRSETLFRERISGANNTYEDLPYDVKYNELMSDIVTPFLTHRVLDFGKDGEIKDMDLHFRNFHEARQKNFMVTAIADQYLKVRFHYAAKRYNEIYQKKKNPKRTSRQKLNRLITTTAC